MSEPRESSSNQSAPQGGSNQPITAQFIMPWFMGAAWIPKFDGDKSKFEEWRGQVEVMLRAQGLNPEQQADFLLGALEGEAKRELHLVESENKNTGQKVLEALKKLYSKPTTKAKLRANFFNCKQRSDENVNAFILRLRELFSRWREQDTAGTEQRDDFLLDQLMVGLRTGPIKQELSRQIRRDATMTFATVCSEARALERDLQEEEDGTFSHRVTAPTNRDTKADLESWKDQIREDLRQGLIGEMKEQMKALSADLMEEMKAQLATREVPPAPRAPPRDHTARAPAGQVRERQTAAPSYQWDAQGRPICRACGEAGHVQRHCPHRPSGRRDF